MGRGYRVDDAIDGDGGFNGKFLNGTTFRLLSDPRGKGGYKFAGENTL